MPRTNRPGSPTIKLATCFGHIDEWHVVSDKPFCHHAFDLGAWLGQPAVVVASVLFHAGFEAVRPISDLMRGDGVKQLLVESHAVRCTAFALEGDQWLERL